MNIVTWRTWAGRNNPERHYCPDGVKPYYTSIGPTLLANGFRPVGTIYDARREDGPWKRQVEAEMDMTRGGNYGFDVDAMEIVYWVSYPPPEYFYINVYIWGRPLPENAR